jgi:AraC-like DNA-binding protein
MTDPLTEVVSLLRPTVSRSKVVTGSSPWSVRRTELGQPFYCVVLKGHCRLDVDDADAIELAQGDFVLIPAARSFSMSGTGAGKPPRLGRTSRTITPVPEGVWVGDQHGQADVRLLVGHCTFGSPDAALLVTLLPLQVHIRAEARLSSLAQLIDEEARASRPGRELVLGRLLEVLLIEALRTTAQPVGSAGLAQGLADRQLAKALLRMHEQPQANWTIAQLSREAAMSRSAFFTRFSSVVGMAPMAYLLAWRMALAKQMLREERLPITLVAERVGYSSTSTFGSAFARHVGMTPAMYARSG